MEKPFFFPTKSMAISSSSSSPSSMSQAMWPLAVWPPAVRSAAGADRHGACTYPPTRPNRRPDEPSQAGLLRVAHRAQLHRRRTRGAALLFWASSGASGEAVSPGVTPSELAHRMVPPLQMPSTWARPLATVQSKYETSPGFMHRPCEVSKPLLRYLLGKLDSGMSTPPFGQ